MTLNDKMVLLGDAIINLVEKKGGGGDSTKNQNPTSSITRIYDWIGTQEEYEEQNVETLHPEWCCYITDDIKNTPSERSSLEIGDIGMALYVDETKGLRRYLNGSIVALNDNTRAFFNRLKEIQATNPEYFTDEATWQSEATMSVDGCVYKFVIDETASTIRLPKYPEYVEVTNDNIPVVGNGYGLGLTDGTQTFMPESSKNGDIFGLRQGRATVPSLVGAANTYIAPSVNSKTIGVTTDPTKSGLETSSDSIVKLKLRYFIQIATGQETLHDIVNELELNNPFSFGDCKYTEVELNNISWLRSQGQWNTKAVYADYYNWILANANGNVDKFKKSTDEYTDYDWVVNVADETFRLPVKSKLASGGISRIRYIQGSSGFYGADGKLVGLSRTTAGHLGYTIHNDDGTEAMTAIIDGTSGVAHARLYANLSENMEGLYLYYYVGETVQNAKLIDAGRLAEVKADKTEVDGQWVFIPDIMLAELVAISTTATAFDISEYLPNDLHDYEVMFSCTGHPEATAKKYLNVYLQSDLTPNHISVCGSRCAVTGIANDSLGTVIVPVGTGRTIQIDGLSSSNASGTVSLYLRGYRRLGRR